jgi:hypothetical protein
MKHILTFISIVLFFLPSNRALAEEGMLIPSLLQAFESDMKAKGMKISVDDIYSINHSSLKDAVMHFGGGCTAELVSNKGLLLTNHHCGLSEVQSHSSIEKDYLKNGFWAKNFNEELSCPSLTATRIVEIEDVTQVIKNALIGIEGGLKREEAYKKILKTLCDEAVVGSHHQAVIQAFDYGNSYFLMVKEVFSDVRLVGAPPSSIGKFGGDTDNWIWPRHTGDFCVFRIYSNTENKPAGYNLSNVPYQPLKYLKIAFNDRKENDFTMVYGFPGQTEQHLSSGNLKYIVEEQRPMEIAMRTASLNVIGEGMKKSDQIRIQYMAKQASLANAWKKHIGQIEGLEQLGAVDLKLKFEDEYMKRANSKDEWRVYTQVISRMNALVQEKSTYEYHYTFYYEFLQKGAEFFKLCRNLEQIEKNYSIWNQNKEWEQKRDAMLKGADGFFKNYDRSVDQEIFAALNKEYFIFCKPQFQSSLMKNAKIVSSVFSKSVTTDSKRYTDFLQNFSSKSLKKMLKDPAYILFKDMKNIMDSKLQGPTVEFNSEMDAWLQLYVEGKQKMFTDMKQWSDANSTLRLTYGQLEGSAPTDGMAYTSHTTLKGMIDKNKTGNPDFELQDRMKELYKEKNYGSYAQNGELWVCFTGSNHTTGGNSGSPVLDAYGNLMGLNFDRTWESTMSDFYFDPKRCRNVVVDIRYVLWVMDIYCGAKNLVDEMELVK